MKPQEKAAELIEKFGCNSIERVDYTLDIWEYKKLIRSQEIIAYQYIENKHEITIRGFDIAVRTLKYWNNVKIIINNEKIN